MICFSFLLTFFHKLKKIIEKTIIYIYDGLNHITILPYIYRHYFFTVKKFFICFITIVLSYPAGIYPLQGKHQDAQLPELTETAGLNDYLQYAELSNPAVGAAFDRWKSAIQKIPQARSLPDPRFIYTRKDETHEDPRMHIIGISQMVPWLPKLFLKMDIAEKSAGAEYQKYLSEKNKLFFNFKNAYFELYFVEKSEQIVTDDIELMKNLESVIRSQYENNLSPYSDLIKLQVELGKLENRLQEIRSMRVPLYAQMNAYLDRPPDSIIYPAKSLDKPDISLSDNEIVALMQKENPELREIDYTISARKSGIKLAGQNFYPDLDFGMDFMYTKDKMHDSLNNPATAMLSVSLPLWFDNHIAFYKEEKENYYASLKDIRNAENNLTSELKMAVYKLNDSIRKINLYSATLIPKGEESLNVVLQDLRTQKSGFLDFIDSQRLLLEFRLEYHRALTDANRYFAQIEMITGKDLTGNRK